MTTSNTFHGFPSHDIPKEQKGREWILQFMKAAHKEVSDNSYNVFYGKRYVYQDIRQHTQGQQPINAFKKQLGVDETDKDSWYAINWKPLPILPRLRRMALSSIAKRQHDAVINPLDPRIQQDDKKHLDGVENKLKLKEQLSKISPELAQTPGLQPNGNEPKDLYELEAYRSFGYKHNIVSAMEKANKIILIDTEYENYVRDILDQQQMDFGVSAVKQDMAENGRIILRPCEIPNMVASYFRRPDAQDARFIGEIVPYTLEEIRKEAGGEIPKAQLMKMIQGAAGKYGNPNRYPQWMNEDLLVYDTYRFAVLDLEFKSVNQMKFESRTDSRNNTIERLSRTGRVRERNSYDTISNNVVYTGKWVIGTDMLFSYGLKKNMPKSPEKLTDCDYSYKIQCTNLHDMSVVSKVEETIPVDDQIQIAWFKMQHEVATSIPNGWWIDPDALANLAIGEGTGGEVWSQKKILDLFFKRGILVGKKKNVQGKIDPNPPIQPLANEALSSVDKYLSIISSNIALMRQILGVNEYVDGQNIDSRTLKNVTEMAQDALNNSLFDIVSAERKILHAVTKENVLRTLDLIEMDALPEMYINALGRHVYDSLTEIDDITSYMMSVEIEPVPSEYERQAMLQRLSQYATTGLVEPSDEAVILSTRSVKAAWAILEARMKKRKDEKTKEQLALMQQNAASNAQAGQAVEQAKAETEKLRGEIKAMLETIKGEFMVKSKEITADAMIESAQVRSAKD